MPKRTNTQRITLAAGTVLLTLGASAIPALAVPGDLYASDYYSGDISRIAPDGTVSVFANTGPGTGPEGLAFDARGNLYVANYAHNNIVRFTPDGVETVFASTGLNGPLGLAFDTNGNLYVANVDDDTVARFTKDGVASVFVSTGLNGPDALVFDKRGNLYVSNRASGTITRFTPSGASSVYATGLDGPLGLAYADRGVVDDFYATSFGDNLVFYDFNGQGLQPFRGVKSAFGLAADANGLPYVSDEHDGTIERFLPALNIFSVFATGLSRPGFLVFEPAAVTPSPLPTPEPVSLPEPESAALMAISLAVLGALSGRQRV